MTPEGRREELLSYLETHRRASVEELAGALGTSRETIRRDLTDLDTRGMLRKVHGGALAQDGSAHGRNPVVEGPFAQGMQDAVDGKRRIGEAAAALFMPGDNLFIDTGTTTVYFAEALAGREQLTIVTNSTLVAAPASAGRDNSVYLLGGKFRPNGAETLGSITLQQVPFFSGTHVVLTVGAINCDGIFDFDIEEAELAKAMLDRGKRLTVLADAKKFDQSAVFKVAGLDRIERLVCDRPPPRDLAEALARAKVQVILAEGAVLPRG